MISYFLGGNSYYLSNVPCHFILLHFISFNNSMNIYLFDDIIPLFYPFFFRPEEGSRLQNYLYVHSSIL